MIDRRSFIGLGALALCATGLRGLSAAPCCAAKKCKKVPFKLGIAGYTYNKFSIDETLAFRTTSASRTSTCRSTPPPRRSPSSRRSAPTTA